MITNSENIISKTSKQLEKIANELISTYRTHGFTDGQLDYAGVYEEVKKLMEEGNELYEEILPTAHEIYSRWPEAKQARGERQLRSAMSDAAHLKVRDIELTRIVEGIKTGELKRDERLMWHGVDNLAKYDVLTAVAYGLKALIEENRNPDNTDPYWERIKGAVIIVPRTSHYAYSIHLYKQKGFLEWDDYKMEETFKVEVDGFTWSENSVKNLEILLNSLIREKVFFFPVKSKEELSNFCRALRENITLPFELEVRKYDEDKKDYTGDVVGKVIAEEFVPFTEKDARHVFDFFKEYSISPLEENFKRFTSSLEEAMQKKKPLNS
jgi:hypothetical protein